MNANNIECIIIGGVLLCAVLSLICIFYTICQLKKENNSLSLCKKLLENLRNHRDNLQNSLVADRRRYVEVPNEQERCKIINDGYEILKNYVKGQAFPPENIESTSGLEKILHKNITAPQSNNKIKSSYASDRLNAILRAVDSAAHVRKAPTVSDLHELTLQREQGGKSVGIFRAITPSILVLGILGTLVGVHDKLDELNLEHLAELAPALLPGIFAVITTIIVIFFRGWYNRKWSKFITELDALTVEEILPFFQQPEIIRLDIERFTKTIHEVLEGKNRLDFQKVAEQLRELNGLIGEWQEAFKELGEPLITENLPTAKIGFENLMKYREKVGRSYEHVSNNVRRLQQLCTAYGQNAAGVVEATNVLLENLPGECSHLIERLKHDMPHIRSIHDILVQQEARVRRSEFTEKAKEIQASGKSCAELLEWLKRLPEYAQLGGAYDDFVSRFRNIQYNKAYVEGTLPQYATLPVAYEEKCTSLAAHLSQGKSVLQERAQTLLDTLRGKTEQTNDYQIKLGKVKSLYPPGLFGWKMRLFDLVGNLRIFFYRSWMGRILLLGGLVYFISEYVAN